MKVAAFVVNLIGGIFGVLFSFIALAASSAIEDATNDAGDLVARSLVASLLSLSIIFFAAMIQAERGSPKVAGVLIFVEMFVCLILVGWFYVFPALLLLAGAILCFFVPGTRDGMQPVRSSTHYTSKTSDLDELERLAALRDRGVITQDELEARKRLILDRPSDQLPRVARRRAIRTVEDDPTQPGP